MERLLQADQVEIEATLSRIQGTWPPSSRCPRCGNVGLCKADCSTAPWNFENVHDEYSQLPTTTHLGHLLRKRRWVGRDLHIDRVHEEEI